MFPPKINTAYSPKIRRAKPRTLFYRLECSTCDQIFGTKWIRESVWQSHSSAQSNGVCSLCGSHQIKCKPINKEEYDELERIWDLEDLQFNFPDEDDNDVPIFDLSSFS